ncbi:MAG: hypothetical protein RSG77_19840 [Hafnia sp.]
MDTSKLVGYFQPEPALLRSFSSDIQPEVQALTVGERTAFRLNGFLSEQEVSALLASVHANAQVPVGRDGYVKNHKAGDPVCSLRSTLYERDLAARFFERLNRNLQPCQNRYLEHLPVFDPTGVNPAMRFIDYPAGGWLVPHYDFPFRVSEHEMTLYSLVVFLTSNVSDGATRFIREYRANDDSDWLRPAQAHEIMLSVNPKAGDALLFPHDILHEGELTTERKIILRTDIMFKELGA